MIGVLEVFLWVLIAPLLGLSLYLLLLTLAAPFGQRRGSVPRCEPRMRLAVLIPAHNEELLIGRLLRSLEGLDYPRSLYDVFVVADNCEDMTAATVRRHRTKVYERFDEKDVGKGFALRWLLQRMGARRRLYDGFIIFDADSLVSENFLQAMNDRLCSGSMAIQGYYTAYNPGQSPGASLRFLTLALVHYLRPLGKQALGASCGLKGNGMCLARSVVERFGWEAFSLAEDVEHHLRLVSAGLRVDFAPEAMVWAQMPAGLRQAQSQNLRWETGRLQAARQYVLPLLWRGLRTRSIAQVDGAVEQLVPPLSVLLLVSLLALVSAAFVGSVPLAASAAAALLSQGLYMAAGLWMARAPLDVCLSLIYVPAYVVWKVGLYARVLAGGGPARWARTARTKPR